MDTKEFNRLLKRLTKDDKAMIPLFDFYFKRIVYHLHAKYGRVVAEDAAQTFFQSLLDLADKQSYIEYPTSWVYVCSENIAKRIIETDSRIQVPQTPIETALSREELYGDLYNEIKKLDKLDQEIIFKYFWEGYSFEEIAMKLHCKSNTVRQRFRRASIKLKNCL